MTNQFYGVFIGINEYLDGRNLRSLQFAEKDAQDMCRTLTDPEIGFANHSGNIEVLLGQEATRHNIEGMLYTTLVKKAKQGDTVIVYYSGHGFLAGEEKTAYLGTFDTKISDIAFNPNSGLRMSYVYQDIFQKSPARNILFILDCCNSGAFIPPTEIKAFVDVDTQKLAGTKQLIDGRLLSFPDNEGYTMARAVMFSSPAGVESRENEQYQNGVFTYYLLRGLRGEDELAIEAETREVTIDSLNSYIKRKVPEKQPPGFAGKVIDRFVLTRNHPPRRERNLQLGLDPGALDAAANLPLRIIVSPLPSPFDAAFPFIRNITSRLEDPCRLTDGEPGACILNIIRDLYDAKFVTLLHLNGNESAFSRFTSELVGKGITEEDLIRLAANRIRQGIAEKVIDRGVKGVFHNLPLKQVAKYEKVIVVPIDSDDYLIIFGTSMDAYIGEIYACILQSVYYSTSEFTYIAPDLEARILDELKRTYSYVSQKMYQRRFELFDQELKNDTIFFEPILFLDSKDLDIHGWEALAREDNSDHAPAHLFSAAELWGDRFTVRLDSYFLLKATERYREQLNGLGKRPNEFLPLSVNVYPTSLVRTAYQDTLADVVDNYHYIPGHKLILEISEKLPIVPERNENPVLALRHFRKQLVKLSQAYNISFAIDDFGSGYSSISRFATLKPKYLKIDREILLQKDICDITLQYIRDITCQKETSTTYVIVEGFDGTSDMAVSLGQIYQYGIRYVQGYVVGRAGSQLYDLDDEAAKRLKNMLAGEMIYA